MIDVVGQGPAHRSIFKGYFEVVCVKLEVIYPFHMHFNRLYLISSLSKILSGIQNLNITRCNFLSQRDLKL